MDQLSHYREIVRDVLREYCTPWPGKEIQSELIIDPTRDHYEVMDLGWDGHRRVHHSVVHLDIIDGKIWIQHDATDRPVADYLLDRGVPKHDIVLGFYSPRKRAMTEFAVT